VIVLKELRFVRQNYSVSDLPLDVGLLSDLDLACGFFDRITLMEDGFLVAGWMLLPNVEFDSIQLCLNGELVGSPKVELHQDREGIGEFIQGVPHARRSGFRVVLDRSLINPSRVGRIDLLGCNNDRPVARMGTLFRTDLDSAVPTPPPELMLRVAATQNPNLFKLGGLKCFGDFLESICRHRDLRSGRRLLDWGCGCGRLTGNFLSLRDGPEVFGCDIDTEAIAWCGKNLLPGLFTSIDAWPPLPYEDATFDFAVGYSVFTHLAREVQNAWLEEMRRIIAPGGLFLASIHGEFVASVRLRNSALTMVLQDGIFDENLDPTLDEVAPKGYYRGVYQTREYTMREWSKWFEIVDYLERGIGGLQDLVVMRRPM
jgi:SAM-dependent methyltransferase